MTTFSRSALFPSSACVPLTRFYSSDDTWVIDEDFVERMVYNMNGHDKEISPVIQSLANKGVRDAYLATHLGLPGVIAEVSMSHNITVFSPCFRYSNTILESRHRNGAIWFDDGKILRNRNECRSLTCIPQKVILKIENICKPKEINKTLEYNEKTCPVCFDDLDPAQVVKCVNNHSTCSACHFGTPSPKKCPKCRGAFKDEKRTILSTHKSLFFKYGMPQFLGMLRLYISEYTGRCAVGYSHTAKHTLIAVSFWFYVVHINEEPITDFFEADGKTLKTQNLRNVSVFQKASDFITSEENLKRLEKMYRDLYYLIAKDYQEKDFIGHLKSEFGAEVALEKIGDYHRNTDAKMREFVRQYMIWNLKHLEEKQINGVLMDDILEGIFLVIERYGKGDTPTFMQVIETYEEEAPVINEVVRTGDP